MVTKVKLSCDDAGHGACAGSLYRRDEPPTYRCQRHILLRHYWYALPISAANEIGSFGQWMADLSPIQADRLLQMQGDLGVRYWSQWAEVSD